MNLLTIQDTLKNASDEQLVRLVNSPQGTTPSYLVVSELHRRKQMRMKQAEPPSRTVAEDLTSEENMQAPMGIRSLQTPEPGDEDYPTEEDAPGIEAMREGGIVRMSVGSEVEGEGEIPAITFGRNVVEGVGGVAQRMIAPPSEAERRRIAVEGLQSYYGSQSNLPSWFTTGANTRRRASEYLDYVTRNADNPNFNPQAMWDNPEDYIKNNPISAPTQPAGPAAPPAAADRPAPVDSGSPPTSSAGSGAPPSGPRGTQAGAGGLGGAPSGGVRALTPRTAPPAAAPDAMPTLQQNMERNLGMFPGIPQELMDRIRDSRTNEGDRRREAQNMALLEAGLRIAGSNNPNFLGAIGEGATPAAQTYAQQLSQIRQDRRADIQTDLAVAQADLQRRYMAGQISAAELHRQTQMLMSREERAARLEAARMAAGSADARADRLETARAGREDRRYEQGLDRAQAERTAQEVNKALMDQATRGAARVALRGTNPRAEITDAQIDSYIENRVTGMMDRAYARARGLPTSTTPRDNASVVQPPGAR